MKKILIVPHQDDELFISSMLSEFDRIIIAFRGGGESKAEPDLTEEELFNRRKAESILVCSRYTQVKPEFLEIRRHVDKRKLRRELKKIIGDDMIIITTHKDDAHHEHKLLGKMIYDIAENSYGFFVNTDCLNKMLDKEMPDKYLKLDDQNYAKKKESCDLYDTQKHFLPNVIARPQYVKEYLWKM